MEDSPPSSPAADGQDRLPCVVVGIGASAGGLEALQKFFSHMSSQSGLAFVVVQHLDPRHESVMGDLIAKSTTMPVHTVSAQTAIEPDHIYVIAPNVTLTLADGRLLVQTPIEERAFRAPIDKFFRSLAEAQHTRAICIILSGTGSDGTIGLKAVKEHGGLTLAQSPESAKYDSMPRNAIGTGLVDHVLAVDEMPRVLIEYSRYLHGATDSEQLDEAGERSLTTVCRILKDQTGHDFFAFKTGTLLRRVLRRMRVLFLNGIEDYVQELRSNRAEAQRLFKDLLIGVTHFFRDPNVFHALETRAIPDILQHKSAGEPLRVWVPGCASGEEAYSIAILIYEQMIQRDITPQVQIFGTDLDEESLVVARQAFYADGIADHVTAERLQRYFVQQANGYLLRKEIRDLCIFSVHNLAKDPPFSRLDLISCRNLLIYWESELQNRIISVFHYGLQSKGFLLLGPSEQGAEQSRLFRPVDKKSRLYQKLSDQSTPPLLPLVSLGRETSRNPHRQTIFSAVSQGRLKEMGELFERVLREEFGPAAVLVNDAHEVLYATSGTKQYLELPEGTYQNDIFSMIHPQLRLELQMGIHKAHAKQQTVVQGPIELTTPHERLRVRVTIRPVSHLNEEPRLYMIVFETLGQVEDGGVPIQSMGSDAVTQHLEEELRNTKEQLQASIEDLQSANEELNASNEELLSMNEELHSTNEELQTSQEELQSVNEELETVNSELRQKLEELDHARSDVENLLQNTQVAILFLDESLQIVRFTPSLDRLFRIIPADVGRSIRDIVPRFHHDNFLEALKGVWSTLVPLEQEVWQAEDATWHLMRVLPYRTLANVVGGLLITFVDITDRKRAAAEVSRLAEIVDHNDDAILSVTFDGVITTWNGGAARLFGYSPEEVIGMHRSMLLPPGYEDDFREIPQKIQRGDRVPPFEGLRVTKAGRVFDVSISVSPVRSPSGEPIGFASIKRDISLLKGAEREVKRLNMELAHHVEELQKILDVVPVGIMVAHDPDCRTITANNAARHILGTDAGQNISKSGPEADALPFTILKNGKALEAAELPMQQTARFGQATMGSELTLRLKDGTEKIITVHALPLLDGVNKARGCVASFLDVTEHKRMVAQLHSTNEQLEHRVRHRTAALRDMASQITLTEQRARKRLAADLHDYLAQMLVFCKIKIDHIRSAGENVEELDRIGATLQKSISYTRTLISELHPPQVRELGLFAASSTLAEEMGRHGLRVTVAPEAFELFLREDTSLVLYQCLRELLTNVLKHSGTPDAELTYAYNDEGALLLVVRDKGCGFEPARVLSHEHPKSSFGLFSVKERVEAVGGRFTVDSSPGRGTIAQIVLPFPVIQAEKAGKATPAEPRSPAFLVRGTTIRVLLVDDHAMVRDGLKSLLESHADIQIVGEAENGQQAVDLATQLSPDVIVMDISLPVMSGIDATRMIKAQGNAAAILGISVNCDSHTAEAMKAAGGLGCMSKASAGDQLYEEIQSAMREVDARDVDSRDQEPNASRDGPA